MILLFAQVVVLSLLGALMPSRLLAVGSLLATRRPLLTALCFYAACTAGYLLVTAIVASSIVELDRVRRISEQTLTRLELAAGIVLLAFATFRLIAGPEDARRSPAWVRRLQDVDPGRALAVGAVAGALGLRNIVILLVVSGAVAEGGYGTATLVACLLCAVAVFSLPMLVPIAVFLRNRAAAARLVGAAQRRVLAGAHVLTLGLAFGFGGLLVAGSVSRGGIL